MRLPVAAALATAVALTAVPTAGSGSSTDAVDPDHLTAAREAQSAIDQIHAELPARLQAIERRYHSEMVPHMVERNRLLEAVPGLWQRAIRSVGRQTTWGDRVGFDWAGPNPLDALKALRIEPFGGTDAAVDGDSIPPAFGERFRLALHFGPSEFISDEVLYRDFDAVDPTAGEASGVHWLPEKAPAPDAHNALFAIFARRLGGGGAGDRTPAELDPVSLEVATALRHDVFFNPLRDIVVDDAHLEGGDAAAAAGATGTQVAAGEASDDASQ